MPPSDYIQARKNNDNSNNNNNNKDDDDDDDSKVLVTMVDGQPYLPFVTIDPTRNESIQQTVAQVLQLHTHTNNNNKDDSDCWKQLQVIPVTGGNTNALFCVSNIHAITTTNSNADSPPPDSVLVRIFGGHGMIDRDMETSTYAALAQQQLALPYYGRFANGRLEGWSDFVTLQEPDMGKEHISKATAQQVAQLHSQFDIPKHLLLQDSDPDPDLDPNDDDPSQQQPAARPTMWMQLHSWLEKALKHHHHADTDTTTTTTIDLPQLQDELKWLHTNVIASDAKIGFCHNDILASNIMWSDGDDDNGNNDHDNDNDNSNSNSNSNNTSRMQLIDFEYGGINYLSYDIANHFNEFAGGTAAGQNATPDYSLLPSPELQRNFVVEYLSTFYGNGDNDDNGQNQVPPSEQDIQTLLREIKGFVLANHLVWGLWGINQAATEGCADFDYLHYGKCRIDRYYYDKQIWQEQEQEQESV